MTDWNSRLRSELCRRADAYAAKRNLNSYHSLGSAAVTLFPGDAALGTHGNFSSAAFTAINANPSWKARLAKPHPQRKKALPAPYNATAKELDSCTSSDALLMNCFCWPGVVQREIAGLLQVAPGTVPSFGVEGSVPLRDGGRDATEIDMLLGSTLVEAKLTEGDFTKRDMDHVARYARLYDVFERGLLPAAGDKYQSYQLIRNVLAMVARPGSRFVVLLDARRPDLLHEWWRLHAAIRGGSVRARCGVVLWQEVAAAAPPELRRFLAEKYGL